MVATRWTERCYPVCVDGVTGDTIAVGNPVVNRFISHQRKYIEKDKEARFAKISQTFLRLPVTLRPEDDGQSRTA